MQHSIIRKGSAWQAAEICEFLDNSRIPVRLAGISSTGTPLICSLWYVYADGALWCATQSSSHIAGLLRRNPHCGFEIAADTLPYRGVRGQGQATLSSTAGPPTLLQLIDRYLEDRESDLAQWLLAKQADELAIRIEPLWITAWDYSARMPTASAA
jgi:nitroimidazol reductase NimA-like FMN-containing flavoprotein (pyridoxamine 5'-phosphate oxidase superfamily)